jgi:ligand-binding sensor domain-containing protein/two-component sensor histidine kinase
MLYPLQRLTTLLSCFAFFLFSSFPAIAQRVDIKCERFTTDNRLSSNVVLSILQDKRGFLWIATNDGLNRYDGYNFKVYRNDPKDSNSISANSAGLLFEDGDGNLWVGTTGGLCRYDQKKDQFTRISDKTVDLINNIVRKGEEQIVVAPRSGLSILNFKTLQLRQLKIPDPYRVALNTIGNVFQDAQRNIYIPATRPDTVCYLKYEPSTGRFSEFSSYAYDSKFVGEGMTQLIDSRNRLWIGKRTGELYRCFPGNGESPQLFASKLGVVNGINEDSNGDLWITTTASLFKYDHSSDQVSEFHYNNSDGDSGGTLTNCLYKDRSGILWIGSYAGLFKFNPSLNLFQHFTAGAGNFALKNNFILGLNPLGNDKAAITYQWGVRQYSILDLPAGKIEHHQLNDAGYPMHIWNIYVQNKQWADSSTWKWYLKNNLPINGSLPLFLMFDNKKRFWLAGLNTIRMIREDDALITQSNILDAKIINHEIWVVTDGGGLFRFDTDTKTSKNYVFNNTDKSINNNTLTCLLPEKNGDLWVGTKGGGLNYYDRKNDRFVYYTTANGLCNNSVFNMVKDDRDRLWVGTGNGLSCFDPVRKVFKNYFKADGLNNSEFNRYSACKLENGYLLMGGMDGIDYFHPDSILSKETNTVVQVTDLRVYNRSVRNYEDITLSYDQNYVTIDFAVMDFRNRERNRYQYKLEGADKDWIDAGDHRSVSYATLSPGHYRFFVRASTGDGIWSKEPATVSFSIKGPWWRSWWFYSICVLAVAALLFWFYRFRIRQLKKMMELRTKISQDLHDDVGATLSGIKVFSQLAVDRPEHSTEYLQKINAYSDEMLSKLSDIVWTTKTENDNFSQLISRVHTYASSLAQAKGIALKFEIDPVIQNNAIEPTIRRNIYLVIKEAVNNAVKHANCTNIDIIIRRNAGAAELMITDNGRGFDPAIITEGNGLYNIEKRVKEINGKLNIEAAPGTGTKIVVLFKLT